MLTRETGYLTLRRPGSGSAAAKHLQAEGYVVLEQVFTPKTVETLAGEVERIYEEYPPDERSSRYPPEHWEPFRYEMLNRSAAVQRAIANRKILSSIEPLLGEDCHVIANTAWWQPPDNNKHGGRFWHIDSGPHVPRPPGVPWDERIPYPVFAVAAHIYLMDCPLKAGPTGVIPRSHMSGQPPPMARAGGRRPRLRRRQGRNRWSPRRATSRSSSRTSGTAGCRLAAATRAACSSSATTGGATSPSASGRRRR